MVLIYFKKYLFESLTIIFNYSGTTVSYIGEQVKNNKEYNRKTHDFICNFERTWCNYYPYAILTIEYLVDAEQVHKNQFQFQLQLLLLGITITEKGSFSSYVFTIQMRDNLFD
jgi:hypothetical protein